MDQTITLSSPLLLLHYIVLSLILAVFSSFVIFLRMLLNHVGSLSKSIHTVTALLNLDSQNTDDYHVTFISRQRDDSHLCNDTARWCPLWSEY